MNRLAAVVASVAIPMALGGAAPAKPTDWTKRVAATTDGGYVMGNPGAKVTLVEYASLTCPHCRYFAETGVKPLKENYIRSGKVRYEFRNFVLNGYDLAASVIARCGGARTFFPVVDHVYATQESWIDKVRATPKARLDAVEAMPDGQKLAAMADIAGLKALAASKGVPVAASTRCLADPKAAERLMALTNAANAKYGVSGTPTFFLNGKKVEGADWPSVEAALKSAL
jgi:protein-disulfide isomerase